MNKSEKNKNEHQTEGSGQVVDARHSLAKYANSMCGPSDRGIFDILRHDLAIFGFSLPRRIVLRANEPTGLHIMQIKEINHSAAVLCKHW